MNFATLRLPTFLLALAPLAGCLGAVDTVEQDSASLSRERDRVADEERRDLDRVDDGERFERCTRDWDCRPGDFCLAPDGDDRGDRPDVQYCGREPAYACESDRECGRGAECARDGSCVRLREHKDDCNARHYRAIANRIRNAVADGSLRPATARALWRRLANAVEQECGDGGDDVRKPAREPEREPERDPNSRDGR
jgi:hypothetical protein